METHARKNVPLFMLRYRSNRGTDQKIVVALSRGTTDKQALEVAKEWAERSTAGTACQEYTVTVKRLKPLTERSWRKKWATICKRKQAVDDEYSTLRAMRSAYDWSKNY
jgi:hypothetical protein